MPFKVVIADDVPNVAETASHDAPFVRERVVPWILTLALPAAVLGLVSLGSLSHGVAAAQDRDHVATVPIITVTGHGTASTPPDSGEFTAGVEVVTSDIATAQSEATQRMTAVLEALRASGIPEAAIQTVGFRVEVIGPEDGPPTPVAVAGSAVEPAAATVGTPAPAPPRGFRVVNEVRVTVADLERLGEEINTALASGANTISSIELTAEDPSAAQRQARTLAIEDAHTTAEDLAAAAQRQLGDVLKIVEADASSPPQPVIAEAQMAAEAVPIAPGQTELSVTVHVTYRLLPTSAPAATPPAATPSP